jgi:hypothetical protein
VREVQRAVDGDCSEGLLSFDATECTWCPEGLESQGSECTVEWKTAEVGEHDLCVERVSFKLKRLFDGEVGGDGCGLEIDHSGYILCALDGGEAILREACELPECHRAAWSDRDLTAAEGDHALIFKAENIADLSGRHDAERVIAPAFIDGSACEGERSGDSGVDGDAFLASAALECGGLFWRELNSVNIRQEGALSSEGWQARLGRGALLRSEENFAGWRQWQNLEGMSAESEEDVTQKKDAGGAVADSVMRGEDEDAVRLLMEQYSTEERCLIGCERFVYFFGNLPLPPGVGRRNHAERDALAADVAEMRDAIEGGVDAGREQRVALLYCVERFAPLLDVCVAGDLGSKGTVGRKVLVEEAEELFKGAEGTEQIAGQEFERLIFKGGRRHDAFLFQV